ncbi:MAG: methyl-accepting chemotaxis protein [Lachnospiraceae bacterium]|nr:methyl-accepting chemotaxis protein [Lachnospiraceae bacterium]
MKKIQTKILLLVILATLGVTIINCAESIVVTQSSTMSTIENILVETMELAAASAQNAISSYTATISEIASNSMLPDGKISSKDKQAFLNKKANAYNMRYAGLANAKGYDSYHKKDISDTVYYKEAMKGHTYMTSPYVDGDDSYIIISAPVRNGDKIVGLVYFQCDATILQSIVNGVNIGENGEAYILDKEGTTIAYVDDELLLSEENAIRKAEENPDDKDLQTVAAIEKKMIAGESGLVEYYYEDDNSNNVQVYGPIPDTDGWSIAINLDKDEFMRPAYTGINKQVAISAVISFIIILISAVICRSISKPIVSCANRLHALSEGDLQSDVPTVKTRDEVHILAESISHLVDNFRTIVDEMGRVLGSISNGDLTQSIASDDYPGDFHKLQLYLITINEKLNATMGGIVEAANYVSAGSEQVATASAELSQGAVSQSGAVQQLSATIEDMDSDAKQTAQLSAQTKDAVKNAESELQESNKHIESLNEAMELITTSSNEIKKIIDTIDNIAFQTNILALNASVEAARAGEAGKGFSVVAEEVSALASKSDQAAKATIDLIQNSISAVESGSDIVQKVTNSVATAVELSEQAVSQMDIVAAAVERQTFAIDQVSEAAAQISYVVQTNSTTAEESAATSKELSEQANKLDTLVRGFSLKRP